MGWIILPRGVSGTKVPSYLEPLLANASPDGLYGAIERALEHVNARFFNFAAERRARSTAEWIRFAASNVNPEWLQKYTSRSYENIDPRVHHARNHLTPLLWDHTTFGFGRAAELYEEASSYGILSGISIPIRSPGGVAGFSAVFDSRRAFKEQTKTQLLQARTIGIIYVAGSYAYESLLLNDSSERSRRLTIQLSPRQRDCLIYEAQGLQSDEAAKAMGVTVRTVQFHWSEIHRKLNARTRAQAVATAILGGLIEL